ncbi:MAG TPA: M1 family aminopeptidase, partial [Pyrinomonadaceae bacterium]
AHQWFGDSVTEATWSDLWLSEGFAQYFAGLFVQRHEGEAAFQNYMRRQAEVYFSFEKQTRQPIHDTETENLFKLLNGNNYQKGAWVLHMLRSELGDDKFFGGVRLYYQRHRNATATTEDLRAALEKVSGRDLKQFFASWIYGAGHPRYQLSWKWNDKTKKVTLVLRQLQTEPAFPNALPVEIVTNSGKRRIVIKPTSKEVTEEVKLDEAPASVNVDPDNTVLKEVNQ